MGTPFGSTAAPADGEGQTVSKVVASLLPAAAIKTLALPALAFYAMTGAASASTSTPFDIVDAQDMGGTSSTLPMLSVPAKPSRESAAVEHREATKSDALATSVRELRESAGLTWEQLALLFGVSRRAVHHWSNGSRMTGSHVQRLSELRRAILALPGTDVRSRRSALFAPDKAGYSTFDRLRATEASRLDEHNLRYGTAELLGAVGGETDD